MDVEFDPENSRDILDRGKDAFRVVCFEFGVVDFKLAGHCVSMQVSRMDGHPSCLTV